MTRYYVVEEEDSFHADDFGNDDAPAAPPRNQQSFGSGFFIVEDPDEFFADDYGNDDAHPMPRAPTGIHVTLQ